MSRRKNILFVAAIVIFTIIATCTVLLLVLDAFEKDKELESAAEEKMSDSAYIRNSIDIDFSSGKTVITNWTDGYKLTLPEGINGKIEYNDLNLKIDCGYTTYKIYMEEMENQDEVNSYLSYSNKFIENKTDHKQAKSFTTTVSGNKVQITEWSRNKLEVIDNDQNNYFCADAVLPGNKVFTVFVKSSKKISFDSGCREIIEQLQLLDEDSQLEADGTRSFWSDETKQVYKKYFGKDSGLTWGVFKWGIDEDWNYLTDLENKLDYNFDILLYYSHFESDDSINRVKTVIEEAARNGRTVELTLQTQASDEGNMVYAILDGEYDDFLSEYARVIADLKSPVLFRLCNEMNGDWCEYSAFHTSKDTDIFNEMYKYVYEIFEKQGANAYTIWVWNPNEKSFPDYKWNYEFNYYPGDEYVDVVGITGYNTGSYYEGEEWREFEDIYDSIYKRTVANYDKPLMITEFACSSSGGDKVKWIKNMFSKIEDYEAIKVAVWWDGCDYDSDGKVARSYLIEEDEKTIQTFKDELKAYK